MALLTTVFVSSLIIFDLPVNVVYNNILNVALWALFGIFFIMKKHYNLVLGKMTLAYVFFTIFSLSSIFWALDLDLAFSNAMSMAVISINFIVLHALFKRYDLENTVLYGILLGVAYNYMIAFNLIGVNYEVYEFGRFTGSVGNPNKLGIIMLFSIFASLILLSYSNIKFYFKIYNYVNILLASYIIFLTISKKAIILAPLLVLASISIRNFSIKNFFLFVFIAFVSFELLITYMDIEQLLTMYELFTERFLGLIDVVQGQAGDASSIERKQLILQGFDVFSNNPISGIGLSNFRLLAGKYAHNNYVELLTGVGMVGTALYYSMYLFLFAKISRMHPSSLRKYCVAMTFIMLIMDLAVVSYFSKLAMLILLYMYYVAEYNESHGRNFKKESDECKIYYQT
ncbi:MAG: hypothetical protein BV458_07050 [Thermoplasmata archaeon M9B2D]|nr:MAG: hypothetical protein BV458_07050 [Thermoplasmata archaeon M9B2D]